MYWSWMYVFAIIDLQHKSKNNLQNTFFMCAHLSKKIRIFYDWSNLPCELN